MLKVIANTTPIIALADIGQLELLHKLYGRIILPTAVLNEIKSEPARSIVAEASDWIKVRPVLNDVQKSFFRARLHAGEIEVMILAQEMDADVVILDDNTAKKTAASLGLPVTGTLGILLLAKAQGLISGVSPILRDLEADGFFISPSVKTFVLKKANEV